MNNLHHSDTPAMLAVQCGTRKRCKVRAKENRLTIERGRALAQLAYQDEQIADVERYSVIFDVDRETIAPIFAKPGDRVCLCLHESIPNVLLSMRADGRFRVRVPRRQRSLNALAREMAALCDMGVLRAREDGYAYLCRFLRSGVVEARQVAR